jgi:hypothetical protein
MRPPCIAFVGWLFGYLRLGVRYPNTLTIIHLIGANLQNVQWTCLFIANIRATIFKIYLIDYHFVVRK